jgi:uncharacterized protein (TIGR02996 family)
MTPEHAFLQSMLEAPNDLGQPLIFADWLEENGDGNTAELLRLIVAESNSARHVPARLSRSNELRDEAHRRMRATNWFLLSVQENRGGARFTRHLVADNPSWDYLAVCFVRRLIRHARVSLDGDHWVMNTREDLPLVRQPLERYEVERIRAGQRGSFPRFDLLGKAKNLGRASIPVADLPEELVVPVAWLLCEYLCDKQRRVRAGQVVPGTHFFAFCAGETVWRHARIVDNREADQAESLLRERFRSRSLFDGVSPKGSTPLAGLLVRVSDQERITADKLIWVRGHLVKETSDLPPRADATLPEGSFHDALVDLKLNAAAAAAFDVAAPERLRELFRSQAIG